MNNTHDFENNLSSAHDEMVGHDPLTATGQQRETQAREADASARPAPKPVETSASASPQEGSAEVADKEAREAKSEDASVSEQQYGETLTGAVDAKESSGVTADDLPTWQSLLKRLNAKAVGTREQYLQFGPFTYDDGALTQIVGGRSRRITLALYNKDLDLRARIIEAARQSGCINPDSLPEELEPVQKRLDEFWEEINGMRDLCEGYGYVITASYVGLTVALKKEKKGAATTVEVTN
ncbi:MAG: hypothetical protein LCH41_06360 [Armatimonadetes bacterium]|nr:hypothetical protein [Armatimonadota bacterium]